MNGVTGRFNGVIPILIYRHFQLLNKDVRESGDKQINPPPFLMLSLSFRSDSAKTA